MNAQSRTRRLLAGLLWAFGCAESAPPQASVPQPEAPVLQELEPVALERPVALWEGGQSVGEVDAVGAADRGHALIELGDAWTPYLFTDGATADGKPLINAYRATYVKLARGQFGDDWQGRRARVDKYLELYGILPSLSLLRERMQKLSQRRCVKDLDLAALARFEGIAGTPSDGAHRKARADYLLLARKVEAWRHRQRVEAVDALDVERLPPGQRPELARYRELAARYHAIEAAQRRLSCEGYWAPSRTPVWGLYDARLRRALVEFERRHHVYGHGQLRDDTLALLRVPPLELERRDLVRVLTERATQAAGVLEDGSASAARTYRGADGAARDVPDLFGEYAQRIVDAFGLDTPEAALRFLQGLGELPPDGHRVVAIAAPPLPEYYSAPMDLRVEIDRGDVWYDFPYDSHGKPVPQPIERTPSLSVVVHYLGQDIALARYPTTIGGWRAKQIGGVKMWRYQQSPVGRRVWDEITAAPVWLPPETTALEVLLKPRRGTGADAVSHEVNYALTGPGYASALGLVAAYHSTVGRPSADGVTQGYDEGIRTHSASDYMAVEGRQSNGCHRLHNHTAVRLMSFVLARRAHERRGQVAVAFKKTLQQGEQTYELSLDQGGYVFALQPPLPVDVLPGRIRGTQRQPLGVDIPQFDPLRGAYVSATGAAVQLRGRELVEVPMPGQVAAEPLRASAAPIVPGETLPAATSAAAFNATRAGGPKI